MTAKVVLSDAFQLNRVLSATEEILENKVFEEKTGSPFQKIKRERTLVVTPEQSIDCLKRSTYKQTYGYHKVWHLFRRNFRGWLSPVRSRRECITDGMVWTSNPCPVCRDENLVLHYSNVELLKQFINPQTGYVYENTILCLCAEKYEKLLVQFGQKQWTLDV